ncbi:MAG: hypothetical protein U0354_09985 [Candidatus Sericytochromatia bacterium]
MKFNYSNKIIFPLISFISFTIYSCNTDSGENLRIKPQIKTIINYNYLKSQHLGNVSIKIDTSNILKKGFSTKGVNFNHINIRKLKLEAIGLGMNNVSQTVNWQPNTTISFNIAVPSGNNRILVLSAIDAGGKVISELAGALNVKEGTNNIGKISHFDTAIAQTLLGVLKSSSPSSLEKIDLNKLNEFFVNITGFDANKNSFSKISPLEINNNFVSNSLIINNGIFPSISDKNLSKMGSLKVKLNVANADLILSDLSSQPIHSTSNLETLIENVTIGEWYLTIKKDGYNDKSILVNVKDLNTEININLDKTDLRNITQITNQPITGTLKNSEYNEDFKFSLSDYSFSVSSDLDNDGGEDENAKGSIEIDGLGKHTIKISQEDYPVMDNRDDSLTITDETTGNVRTFTADQELQKFHISDGTKTISIETNPDGTYNIEGINAPNALECAKLAMKYPTFSETSPHSLAMILELFSMYGEVNSDFNIETLAPCTPPQANDWGKSQGGEIGNPIDLLKEGLNLIIEKNKSK